MNWRKAVVACAGVLLPLPLVLLLGGLLKLEVPVNAPAGMRVSPMLTSEQRLSLVTYGRACGPGKACEPPLGCLFDVRYARSTCSDSQCWMDDQCPEGQSCQGVATWGDGPLVRVCVPLGPRQEGEGCVSLPRDKSNACAPGLVCGGRTEGWCARPCRLGDTRGCSEGFFCADTLPRPLCLPTCEARGCPAGQQCIRFDEGVSVCAQVYGPHCLQTPCADGRKCDVNYAPPYPDKVWMECVDPCGEDLPACIAGKVCDGWHCLTACDPQGPQVCGEGYHCSRRGEDRPFSCQPIYWDELMAY
ncbi:hypothetical protein SAMN05443639_101401 [Stigmatella erecta]|uniref:Uncharacterized protein n=1 Tax=Stigmatella erecta TaxID=83460 RepID=A0A1H9ZRL9_9BACT|nr:hypothetical protein SAMN05443639_101401 [Stigmatella erecta]